MIRDRQVAKQPGVYLASLSLIKINTDVDCLGLASAALYSYIEGCWRVLEVVGARCKMLQGLDPSITCVGKGFLFQCKMSYNKTLFQTEYNQNI